MTIAYVEKGIGMHRAIQSAGQSIWQEDGDWYSSNDAVVQPIIDNYDPLPEARVALLAACYAERLTRQAKGMPYTFPDSVAGTVQTRDNQDLVNISGVTTSAMLAQAQGVTAPVFNFRDSANAMHAMTPSQMIALGVAVGQFVNATYTAKWAHDDAIRAWNGSTPYDLTVGWPA